MWGCSAMSETTSNATGVPFHSAARPAGPVGMRPAFAPERGSARGGRGSRHVEASAAPATGCALAEDGTETAPWTRPLWFGDEPEGVSLLRERSMSTRPIAIASNDRHLDNGLQALLHKRMDVSAFTWPLEAVWGHLGPGTDGVLVLVA